MQFRHSLLVFAAICWYPYRFILPQHLQTLTVRKTYNLFLTWS